MAFPTVPVLDSGAGSNGALGAPWSASRLWTGQLALQRISNLIGAGSADDNNWYDAFIAATVAAGKSQGYVKIDNRSPITGAEVNQYFRVTNPATGGPTAYYVGFTRGSAGAATLKIHRLVAGSDTTLATLTTQPVADGDWIGWECNGTNPVIIDVYYRAAAGSWGSTPVLTYSDSNAARLNPGTSYFGLEIQVDSCRLSNFAASLADNVTLSLTGLASTNALGGTSASPNSPGSGKNKMLTMMGA